ncbi:MAG: hypothetical protein DSY34_03065, partial [Desulfurobacterium sp.]
ISDRTRIIFSVFSLSFKILVDIPKREKAEISREVFQPTDREIIPIETTERNKAASIPKSLVTTYHKAGINRESPRARGKRASMPIRAPVATVSKT